MSEFKFLNADDLYDDEIYLRLRMLLPEDKEKDYAPSYVFRIMNRENNDILGEITLRVGGGINLYYAGHIGYRVDEKFRGHGYAEKACRIIFNQARKHNMDEIIITCNPDNLPSRRTCEKLGGRLKEIADVPEGTEVYEMGDRQKCIFIYEL